MCARSACPQPIILIALSCLSLARVFADEQQSPPGKLRVNSDRASVIDLREH